MDIFDIFFNVCLGLFIGGIIFSIISLFLAQMESQSLGQEIDTDVDIDADVDVDIDADVDIDVDYDVGAEIDGVEADVDVDIDVDADLDAGVEVDADVDVDMDVDIDAEVDIDYDWDVSLDLDSDVIGTTTSPAPIMLLISAGLLVFGITGIALYYIISLPQLRFIMFIITPVVALLSARYINVAWKKIAKSQYYKIAPTQNLIGREGEVVLPIDKRGGVIRVQSTSPMKYEKLHVLPYDEKSYYARGTTVYIVAVIENKIRVDSNKNLIKRRR